MSKQLTAVEWLLNEFQEAHKDFGGLDLQWLNRFDKALEMEKQQIKDSREDMQKKCIRISNNLLKSLGYNSMPFEFDEKEAEQYYSETYKK